MNFTQRAQHAKNPIARKLFLLMDEKKTNLSVSADVKTKIELLNLVDAVGLEICILKTHIDIIQDFDWDLIEQLQKRAQRYNFMIIEDRKFCDIGSTVQAQYSNGIYKIAQWADAVIAHAISGPSIIDALKQATKNYERGLFLLAEMSSAGNLIDDNYTKAAVKMAQQHNDFVAGCICQKVCLKDPGMLHLTPGINLNSKSDSQGQQFNTPERAIVQNGTDIIIVGRGIYKAANPRAAAQQYREAAWHAYKNRPLIYNEGRAEGCHVG